MLCEATFPVASFSFGARGARRTSMGTLDEAAAYLAGLINVERSRDLRRARLSLEPIRSLLDRLGLRLPERMRIPAGLRNEM